VSGDECANCGVITTKFKGISFVPAAQPPPLPQQLISVPKSRNKIRPRIIWMAVATLFFLVGFQSYRYFIHRLASYSGFYRNEVLGFTLQIPERGWRHYSQSDLKGTDFQDARDAFYRGSEPDAPEVMMAIWMESMGRPIPERLDNASSQAMLSALVDLVQKRMKSKHLQCTITDSRPLRLAGNDGFQVQADLVKGREKLKTKIYCAYHRYSAYTIQFLGPENQMTLREHELDQMIASFSFRTQLFSGGIMPFAIRRLSV
jgi:hypothetical protein